MSDNPGLDAIIQSQVSDYLSDPNNMPDALGSFVTQWQQQNPVAAVPTVPRPLIATLTYSTSITPDCSKGTWQTLAVTNGTAFTINAPVAPPDTFHTQSLTIEVLNNSGGTMGAITWNAIYNFQVAWTNPLAGKRRFVEFRWNGFEWVAVNVASAGY